MNLFFQIFILKKKRKMAKKIITYLILSIFWVKCLNAQFDIWLSDGQEIKNVEKITFDSMQDAYIVLEKSQELILSKSKLFAIVSSNDTIFLDDTVLPRRYAINFLEGYRDGMSEVNPNAFLPSLYLSVFDNLIFVRYSCIVRELPNFALFVISSFSRSDSLPRWNSAKEAYVCGFALGQERRAPLDVAIGTVIGSYISMGIEHFMFEK